MSREPNLEAINRALTITVDQQRAELIRLVAAVKWIIAQTEAAATAGADNGALATLLAEIGTRARMALGGAA